MLKIPAPTFERPVWELGELGQKTPLSVETTITNVIIRRYGLGTASNSAKLLIIGILSTF
jgi:hypothetical protein